MATTWTVPAKALSGRHSFGDEPLDAERDRGPAQNAIGEMARLLHDTRGSMLLGGGVLAAITVGIAVEAAFSASVLRPGAAGVACVAILGVLVLCWLRAATLLMLAGRPVLDELNNQRWLSGAPVDPRVRWLTVPPIQDSVEAWNWTWANLLLGAARVRRERVHLALCWTLITTAVFLLWTVAIFVGL